MRPSLRELDFKATIGVIIFASSCVSAALYADDRYAKSEDLKHSVAATQQAAQRSVDTLRLQMLQDKVFESDLVPEARKSDAQRAIANRNRAQLQELQSRINGGQQGYSK